MPQTKTVLVAVAITLIVLASSILLYVYTRGGGISTVTYTYTTTYTYTYSVPATPATETYTAVVYAKPLRIAIPSDLSKIDIHYATGVADFEVLGKVYEALFRIDIDNATGKLVYRPWLVESYVKVNETFYIFKLRSNVFFHNGKRLDSWDVKASIERAMRLSGIAKQLLFDSSGKPIVKEIRVLNSSAFAIVLSKPYAFLFEALAHLSTSVMPREIAEKYAHGPINDSRDVIGTGPFRFVYYEKGVRVVLERFDGYWGKKPAVSMLTYLILPDHSSRINALLSGEADIAVGVSPDIVDSLRSKGFTVYNVTGVRLVLVAINCERFPDKRFRQALSYAIDKEAIVKNLLRGYASIASSVASPVFPYVYTFKPFEYNASKARELLNQVGYPNRTLILLYSTRSPKDAQLAQVVQQYLKAVGINVEIIGLEHNQFLQKVFKEHDFDLAIYGPSPSSLYYALTYWRTGAYLNGPKYSNKHFDELLNQIAFEVNESRRVALLEEAQRVLYYDAPAIWLYFENILVATKPEVKGLLIMPFQHLRLDNVYIG